MREGNESTVMQEHHTGQALFEAPEQLTDRRREFLRQLLTAFKEQYCDEQKRALEAIKAMETLQAERDLVASKLVMIEREKNQLVEELQAFRDQTDRNESIRERLHGNGVETSFQQGQCSQMKLGEKGKGSLEKLVLLVREKEKRIAELQPFEYSLKKASEQKFELKELLEQKQVELEAAREANIHLNEALAESRKNGEQLERSLSALQRQYQESQDQLSLDQLQLQELTTNSELQSSELEKEKRMYAELGAERDSLDRQRGQLSEELNLLQIQLKQLKERYRELQQVAEEKSNQLKDREDVLCSKEDQIRSLSELFEQKKCAFKSLEEEVIAIKQSLTRGLREAKDLENRFFVAMKEKAATIVKYQQLKGETDNWQKELCRSREQLKQALEGEKRATREVDEQRVFFEQKQAEQLQIIQEIESERNNLKQRLEEQLALANEMKLKLAEARQRQEQLEGEWHNSAHLCSQRECELAILNEQRLEATAEISDLKEKLIKSEDSQREEAQQLVEVRQHLAKKMREIEVIRENHTDLSEEILEVKRSSEVAQEQIEALQEQIAEHTRGEERYSEALKAANAEVEEWKRRCDQLEEEQVIREKRVKEFDQLTARHRQLQSLLANLGSIVSIEADNRSQSLPIAEELPADGAEALKNAAIDAEAQGRIDLPAGPYQNLFALPKGKEGSNKSLFDS